MRERQNLSLLEEKIGYTFQRRELLEQALTHSSYANERRINKIGSYERLEFLGDAVLELVSSEFLFARHPELSEGDLTKLRASMVCEPALAFCARDIGLEEYILLGKGEEATGGRRRDSITSDVMEAVIGAIYLDGGMKPARVYIDRFILSDLEHKRLFYDSKSNLQEVVQGKLKKDLAYELLDVQGPEHCQTFRVQVRILEGETLGVGEGHTKKAAEQQAAYKALLVLQDRGYKPGDI
ncbi:MAG: ribonuclease III [Lachnospiraceae bacterium]|nr:ribonuclease III [Lachnospiraceae bacterium]